MTQMLIVDDDAPLLDSLCFVFRDRYEVRTARSAQEATACLAQRLADIVLLDIALPDVDGLAFLRLLRERYPLLPVVMISGVSMIRPLLKTLDAGGSDFIRKPFEIEELRLVVARALRVADLQRRVAELEQILARTPEACEPEDRPMKTALAAYERALILKALQRAGGVQTRAARMLGTSRRILRYRMSKHGIPSRQESE
jgi:DNA-binding NtrC family response regulator